jgi:hypothetical protein
MKTALFCSNISVIFAVRLKIAALRRNSGANLAKLSSQSTLRAIFILTTEIIHGSFTMSRRFCRVGRYCWPDP